MNWSTSFLFASLFLTTIANDQLLHLWPGLPVAAIWAYIGYKMLKEVLPNGND